VRLFIAINFSSEVKNKLVAAQDILRKHALGGNFTRPENMHLTLIFLGETAQSRLEQIEQAIDSIREKAFELHANGSGRFGHGGGDIWWAGIDENPILTKIHRTLSDLLTASGFEIEEREYKPHLTLARKVLLKNDINIPAIPVSFNILADKISLMKSEHINGILKYTEIYNKKLL
jgi:2'-5' RNA ligase